MDYTALYNQVFEKLQNTPLPTTYSLQNIDFLTPDLNALLSSLQTPTLQRPETVLTELLKYDAGKKAVSNTLRQGERLVKTNQLIQNALTEAETGKYGALTDLLKVHPINEEALQALGTATSILGARMTQVNGQPALMDSSGLLWSLLGAGAGYALGGPIGSVVGGLLGSSVGGVVSDVVSGVGNVVSDVVDTIGDIFGGIF